MDFDNAKLKQLLSEDDSSLPPAFDWEHMEEGIMHKMAALDTAKPPSRRAKVKPIRSIAILILCLLPVLLFNNGRPMGVAVPQGQDLLSKDYVEATKRSANTPPDAQPLVSSPNPFSKAVPKKSVSVAATPKKEAADQPGIKAGEEAFVKENIILAGVSQPDGQREVADEIFVPELPAADNTLPAAPVEPNSVNSASISVLSSENAPIDAVEDPQEQSASVLPPGIAAMAPTVQSPMEATNTEPTTVAQPAQNRRRIPAQQWSLLSGISDWAAGYGGTPSENAPYEQTALSYYTQLSYTHRLGNNYTLTAGLQYQQLETRFAYSQLIEDYTTVTIMDTIVEIQISSLTGNKLVVWGDVEVSVDAVRNVRHHNQYRLIQVPIAVGKSWRMGKHWQADLAVGSAINVLANNQGRSIYQGELQQINGPKTSTIDNRWGIQGLAMARLGYRLNGQMGIMLDVQYQKSLTNWGSAPNLQMHPRIFNLGLGAYYAFRG